jgi:predicted aspartyl protease
MKARGMHVPPPITVQLLVDTGADTTTIAEMHMRSLGLSPSGAAPVRTITTDVNGAACNTYAASLLIESHLFGDRPHEIPAFEVIAREFHNEGIDGLLGRDVLNTLLTTIDGPRRSFILQWS